MEITFFALGILSVVFLLGIIGSVFSAVKISKLDHETNSLTREIEACHRHADSVSDENGRRMEHFSRDVNERFDHLYRELDSRFDKLENRLKAEKTKN